MSSPSIHFHAHENLYMELSSWGLAKGYDCNIMDIKEANEFGVVYENKKKKKKKKSSSFFLRYNLYFIRVKKNKVLSFIT